MEGTYRWTDGYLATWVNWFNDQPFKSSSDLRDCVARPPKLEGFWKVTKCGHDRYYYCETITRTSVFHIIEVVLRWSKLDDNPCWAILNTFCCTVINQGSETWLSTQNFNDCIYEKYIDFCGASERQNYIGLHPKNGWINLNQKIMVNYLDKCKHYEAYFEFFGWAIH